MRHNDNRIGLQDLVDGLLFSLQAEGKSPRTIEYYRDLLRPLLDYARDKGWSDGVSSLDAHRLREFLSWAGSKSREHSIGNGARRVRKAKPSTAWPYYRAVRRLFNWAIEEGYLECSPLATIHFKPPPEPPVEGYTIEELKRLLAVCDLDPFKRCERAPKSVPLLAVLQHTWAFVQLHPEANPDVKSVCKWMERQLGLEEQESDVDTPTERSLPKSNTYGYKVRTREQVREARKREKELLDDYKQWLKKQERHLSVLPYGRLECDAWEKERQNLIEAKGSTSREDIRMAVGQLFDYSFQGKEKYKQPNMAILFPKKPPSERLEWLEPLGIKIIWRRGRSFLDNANGQFT